ncbi:hypothetical protein MRX96_019129 [Rhipicephalus microplus]
MLKASLVSRRGCRGDFVYTAHVQSGGARNSGDRSSGTKAGQRPAPIGAIDSIQRKGGDAINWGPFSGVLFKSTSFRAPVGSAQSSDVNGLREKHLAA